MRLLTSFASLLSLASLGVAQLIFDVPQPLPPTCDQAGKFWCGTHNGGHAIFACNIRGNWELATTCGGRRCGYVNRVPYCF
ncbi:hypothetical protein VTJ04DRAFT_10788 [Mycothermus thermophilus]|uniref:uncharacterized protein n=1 Tax=Humicola insolens TaxID=85995 RepID=UPI0037448A2E